MGNIHGKDTVVMLDDSGGNLRDITAYVNSVDTPSSVDMAEVSAMGQSKKNYIGGQQETTISIGGPAGLGTAVTESHKVLSGLVGGTAAGYSIEVYPAGTAQTKPKLSGEVLLENYNGPTSGLGGAISYTAAFRAYGTAGLTWGTVA